MKTTKLQSVVVALLALSVSPGSAQQKRPNRELAHVPPAVRQAIQARLGDAKLQSIEKRTEDGKTSYDVEIVRNGKERGLVSTEEDVRLAGTPQPVQDQIKKLSASGKIFGIRKIVEDDETSYDVELKSGSAQKTVSIGPDGKVLPADDRQ